MPDGITSGWRPRLWAVLLLVLGLVLCLPFAGLFLFKFYASQLVQQTEESLLAQASVLSATYAQFYEMQTGEENSVQEIQQDVAPVFPSISINSDRVLPPRPDAVPSVDLPSPAYVEIGAQLTLISEASQAQTLAGYRLLDAKGNVIGGSAEVGLSLAAVDEVARGLKGEAVSVARVRIREGREPFLYAFSRGTRVRVFVAMPVAVKGKIIGVVYLSRTPSHIFRFLYGERFTLAKAGAFIFISTALIGLVFWRFITRPIHTLMQRTRSIGNGGRRWEPINHYGTREIENLSNSFQSLTARLQDQQDALKSYTAHVTHELKSPLTGVKGAAELLRESEMSQEQRQRFLDNIEKDTARMEELLASMREFSLADQNANIGTCNLGGLDKEFRSSFPNLEIGVKNENLTLPVHQNTLRIILTHLLENAAQHEASAVDLEAGMNTRGVWLTVSDDGAGISKGNREKIMTPFFTTRREQGGTGMGLNIVKSTVEALGGNLSLDPRNNGTCFRISFTDD
ncbi:sensor histidine kinase [Parasedimentitalea huanghaiensis]|uniref:histidine kinase n=1 Tax=Parasedimentitalea huanghaiensis TaxID=2682100 RepID=A0A6L6WIT4_9RHOB|nr:ATP-binding protein [Zongyanglinia huanghaiensis]MVO17088.1 HAMP domain-containing protein [Zongyanglinia huanghaiensis]